MLNLTGVLGYLWFDVSSYTGLFSIPFRTQDQGIVFKMANLARGNEERGHFS